MLIKLAWRNLWRNKLRTSIMLSAMVFGLIGVVTMMGFMTGMYGNMIDNAIAWKTSDLQVHNRQYVDNPELKLLIHSPEKITEALASMPEVKAWSSRFLVDGMVASARSSRGIRINGVDIDDEAKVTPLASKLVAGSWLPVEGRHPVLVSQKTADRLKLRLGSKVVLTFSNVDKDVTGAAFRVAGIFKTPSTGFDDGNLYVRRGDLMKLAGLDGVHEIAVVLHQTENRFSNEAALKVKQRLDAESSNQANRIRDWQQIQPMLATIISQIGVSNAIVLAIFMLAMGFGIINIMLMSVFERTREFGVLMAVGMQKHKVFTLIILETGLLGVTGGLLGVFSASILVNILQITGIELGAMAEGVGALGVDTTLYPQVSVLEYCSTFATVIIVSLLAALYPARQILKLSPVGAMAEKH
ncbi:ABC transporter permease [Shewanella eurypsychrophilus]|uniref:ABC transporter permease n=1 Tax=Shewanella eurypsychrophilus TaxID=2593656 RepID=A0ABX6VAM7_9GAMM|nr:MULTISPECIES: FtsX-like permease family protein [Shewanella]QFU23710.1 FtsX-like permease family protein [Shewanella sp. YLB-09]QPG58931.1 ABC transporter permease [Shewanella eurypsychrophilus]